MSYSRWSWRRDHLGVQARGRDAAINFLIDFSRCFRWLKLGDHTHFDRTLCGWCLLIGAEHQSGMKLCLP